VPSRKPSRPTCPSSSLPHASSAPFASTKKLRFHYRCHRAHFHCTPPLALKQERHPFAHACRQRRRRPSPNLVRPPPQRCLHKRRGSRRAGRAKVEPSACARQATKAPHIQVLEHLDSEFGRQLRQQRRLTFHRQLSCGGGLGPREESSKLVREGGSFRRLLGAELPCGVGALAGGGAEGGKVGVGHRRRSGGYYWHAGYLGCTTVVGRAGHFWRRVLL
jgi:hypothetical protein